MKPAMFGRLMAGVLLASATVGAQTGDSALQTLLIEIRQFRQSLIQSENVKLRAQIAMHRVETQEKRVDLLLTQEGDMLRLLAISAADNAKAAGAARRLEAQITEEERLTGRSSAGQEALAIAKLEWQRTRDLETEHRIRLSDLRAALQEETARLDEYSARLRAIEDSLSPASQAR